MKSFIYRLNSQLDVLEEGSFSVNDFCLTQTQDASASISAIAIENSVQFAQAYFKALKLNQVPLILNPQIPMGQLREIALTQKARSLITSEGEENLATPYQALTSGQHILCSSGTTSKGSQGKSFYFKTSASLKNAQAHLDSIGFSGTTEKRFLLPMTLSHSFGFVAGLLGTVQSKHHLYTLPDNLTPQSIFLALEKYKIDHLYLTPSLLKLLNRSLSRIPGQLYAPKSVSVGSSLLFPRDLKDLMERLPQTKFYSTYGLTEMGPRAFTMDCGSFEKPSPLLDFASEAPISTGHPIKDVRYTVREEQLHLQSPYQAQNLSVDAEGFYNSTDKVEVENGVMRIQGRMDFTIIKSGMNIYPGEIESHLSEIPEILACCLIPQKSEIYGQVPVLVCETEVVPDPEALKKKILEFLRKLIPPSHLPAKIILRNRPLPRTSMGKIKVKSVIEEVESEP